MPNSISRSLLNCSFGDTVNLDKFFSEHPLTESLKHDLYNLQKSGYISIDEGDNTIVSICLNQKLFDLANK